MRSLISLLPLAAFAQAAALAAGPPGGKVSGLLSDPANANAMYAWSDGAGIFKSSDSGSNWFPLSTGLDKSVKTLVVSRLAPATLYAGTAHGIFKSVNSGATWFSLSRDLAPFTVSALAQDPANPNILYAGTNGSGIYKSVDAGSTWAAVNNGLITRDVNAIVVDPANSATVYAGTFFGEKIFKSTNAGASWAVSNFGYTDLFASRMVIASGAIYACGTFVSKSADGGRTWVKAGDVPVQVTAFAVDPRNSSIVYAGGGIPPARAAAFRSNDGGVTWTPALLGLPFAAVTALLVDPNRSSTLYAGTYGDGTFQSFDSGDHWIRTVPGLAAASITALAMEARSNTVYAAAGSRVFRSSDLGTTWMDCGYPGWTPVAMTVSFSNALYVGAFDNLWRSTDGCTGWEPLMPAGTGQDPPGIESVSADMVLVATVYVGSQVMGLYKTSDSGATWSKLNTGTPQGTRVTAIATDPTNNRIVYAALNAGPVPATVLKSSDAGASWTPAASGLPRTFQSIRALVVTPSTVLAGTEFGVYRSLNGGANWTPANSGIAMAANDITVRVLAFDMATGVLYAGLASGVFKSINGGASWTAVNSGLATPDVTALAVRDSVIYAGTSGAGVFGSTNAAGTWLPTGIVLANPVPVTTSIVPASLPAGSPEATVTVSGSGFLPVSAVRWNGFDRPTTYVSGTQLIVSIPAADLATQGKALVTVFTPAPGGGTSGSQTFNITAPVPNVSGFVNGASWTGGPIAPGEIITVTGSKIGPPAITTARFTSAGLLDTTLAGTRILFDGVPAPLIYVSEQQSSAIVPYSVARRSNTAMQVEYLGGISNTVPIAVTSAVPGIFTANSSGQGQAAAHNEDGSPNSPANPAKRGSIVVFYATGEGQTDPPGVDGKLANAAPFPKPVTSVFAVIGGIDAEIAYAGAVPGQVAGLMQLNVKVPDAAAPGDLVPVILKVGTAVSREGVTIAVR